MNPHQDILNQVTELAQGSATQDDLINAIYAVITKNLANDVSDRFNDTSVKNAISLSRTIEAMAERAKPRLLHVRPSPVETFSVGGSKVEVMNEYPHKPKLTKVEIMNEALGRERVMNVEPNWQGMFDFAINIVRTNIDEGKGGYIALEMLEYGKRLDAEYQSEPKVEETYEEIKRKYGGEKYFGLVKCFNCGYTDEKEEMNPVDDRRSFGDLVNPDTPWYCDDCSEVGEKARLEYEVTD